MLLLNWALTIITAYEFHKCTSGWWSHCPPPPTPSFFPKGRKPEQRKSGCLVYICKCFLWQRAGTQPGLLTPGPVLFPSLVTNGQSLCTAWPHSCTLADPNHQRHRSKELDWLVRLVFWALSLTLANPQSYQAAEHFFFFFPISLPGMFSWPVTTLANPAHFRTHLLRNSTLIRAPYLVHPLVPNTFLSRQYNSFSTSHTEVWGLFSS